MTQTVRRGGEKEKDGGGAIKSRCWFEFVLKKDALPQHLAALKRGEAGRLRKGGVERNFH